MAVWFILLFLEGTFVKLFHAISTDKVLWVKLPVHGSDAPTSDRFVATIAEGTTPGMVMHLTIW